MKVDITIINGVTDALSVWVDKENIDEIKVINHGGALVSHKDENFDDLILEISKISDSEISEIEANEYSLRITTKDHRVYVIYFKTKTNEN